MKDGVATLVGAGAVFLWGSLAVLTIYTGAIPPFQIVATAFFIGFGLALRTAALRCRVAPPRPRAPKREEARTDPVRVVDAAKLASPAGGFEPSAEATESPPDPAALCRRVYFN